MKFPEFNFKFKFGRERMKWRDWVKMSVLVNLGLDAMSFIPGLDRKKAFNFVDEVNLRFRGGENFLNDYIIADDELIGWRIEREVGNAIERHERDNS